MSCLTGEKHNGRENAEIQHAISQLKYQAVNLQNTAPKNTELNS